MITSSPLFNFKPKDFIQRQYSPLIASIVDQDVEKMFRSCGLTFIDFLSSVCSKLEKPIRVTDVSHMQETKAETFFENLKNDISIFSQPFGSQEYESNMTLDLNGNPFKEFLKSPFGYPSQESMNPPWYRHFLRKLIESMRFSDFDFFDIPSCFLYVTVYGSKPLVCDEIRQMIPIPFWMREFVLSVPIIRVIVYDGTEHLKEPEDAKGPRHGFEQVVTLCFKDRSSSSPVDPVLLRDFFRYDYKIFSNPNLSKSLYQADIDNLKSLIGNVYSSLMVPYIEKTISSLLFEIENSKNLKNVVKNWFKKKTPERLTQHLSIPWSKLIFLQLGSMYMMIENYVEAQKCFKQFSSDFDIPKPILQYRSLFLEALCFKMIPKNHSQYWDSVGFLTDNLVASQDIRFLLSVPLVIIEMLCSKGNYEDAIPYIMNYVIIVSKYWTGTISIKNLVLGMVTERLAGVLINEKRSMYYTSKAASFYKSSGQFCHALRCYIWLLRVLPLGSFLFLRQSVILDKSLVLSNLQCNVRSLIDCKDLLLLPNLDFSLHEKVLSLLLSPYNDPSVRNSISSVRINSLLEVRGLRAIDISMPEYWGYPKCEFEDIFLVFNPWNSLRIDRSSNKTLNSWYIDNESQNIKQTKHISTKCKVLLKIQLYNRYIFSVHLDQAIPIIKYSGADNPDDIAYTIKGIDRKEVPGKYKPNPELSFDFVALKPGRFVIESFHKNYWGVLDTEIDCGPVVLNASSDFPMFDISIDGLPEKAYEGQCIKFAITIHNVGESTVNEFLLVYDNADYIAYDGDSIRLKDSVVISNNKPIEPSEAMVFDFVFKSLMIGENRLHFIVSSKGINSAYKMKSIDIFPISVIQSTLIPILNDSHDQIIKTMFLPMIPNLSIIGVMDSELNILRSIEMMDNSPSKINQFTTTLCSLINKDKSIADSWRKRFISNNQYSLLFSCPEIENCFQLPIKEISLSPSPRYHITMPEHISSKGKKYTAVFSITHLTDDTQVSYVQPLPFDLIDHPNAKTHDFSVKGLRWTGVTRQIVSKQNQFKAEFELIGFKPGIYSLKGVSISNSPDFSNSKSIPLSQTVIIL